MVRNLVRKSGVPALAFSLADSSPPWLCSLTLLDVEDKNEFTVLLAAPITIHGIDGDQSFILRFDGDNLKSGKMALKDLNTPVSDAWVKYMTRKGQPQLRMLMLQLKAPCVVCYPKTLGIPVSCFRTPSREIVNLAKTKEVQIVFDILWLAQNHSRFRSIVETSSQLSGVLDDSRSVYSSALLQANWQILHYGVDEVVCSIENPAAGVTSLEEHVVHAAKPGSYNSVQYATAAVLPSIEAVEPGVASEALPAYSRVPSNRVPSKRAGTTQSPAKCPDAKRTFQDPTRALSHAERASSASSTATVKVDVFQEAVTLAVRNVLEEVLPRNLREQLAVMLERSPSLSPSPPPYQISNALEKRGSTLSHESHLRAVVRQLTESQLQRLITNAEASAEDNVMELNGQATEVVNSMLEDHSLDMGQVAEDQKAVFNEYCNESMDDFKMRVEEEIERAKEELERAREEFEQRVREVTALARFEAEGQCMCKCRCFHTRKGNQAPRATSLPLPERTTEMERAESSTDDESSSGDEL